MRSSRLLLATLREAPADAEMVSHRLMLRAGMIRRLAAGIYAWLPLGFKILRKVEAIVREEMDRTGAQEVLLPGVLPGELWRESGRWDEYGPELLRLQDRHERDFCLGPTHEEAITALVRRELRSYKQLPANFYQIQTKFRDEIRPRFGIMRAREFLMKDAYSFHLNQASLQQTYEQMYQAYSRIFERLGLEYRAVLADSGNIGGHLSHEFHVLADSGEDKIAFSDTGDFAANVELAPVITRPGARPAPGKPMEKVSTRGQHTIAAVSTFLSCRPAQCVKTLIVNGTNGAPVALLLRGDHDLNRIKAEDLPQVATPLTMTAAADIKARLGCSIGSLGPVGLADKDMPIIADHAVLGLADFICGANEDDLHLTGVNWGRDLPMVKAADLRNVVNGDAAPNNDGHNNRDNSSDGKLIVRCGIEVGHIFQLGAKYSAAMKASCLDEQGHAVSLLMGCYGIGISRIVAAAIEQNHDEHGIIWPASIAPYQLALIPVHLHKSQRLREAVEKLYQALMDAGVAVLLDDRKERLGVMFADQELIGIPHRLVFSEKGLDNGQLEYKRRRDGYQLDIKLDEAVAFCRDTLPRMGA